MVFSRKFIQNFTGSMHISYGISSETSYEVCTKLNFPMKCKTKFTRKLHMKFDTEFCMKLALRAPFIGNAYLIHTNWLYHNTLLLEKHVWLAARHACPNQVTTFIDQNDNLFIVLYYLYSLYITYGLLGTLWYLVLRSF